MFRLDNKIAVVIGGAGGIGETCAKALGRQGAKVVVAGLNLEGAKAVADQIKVATGLESIALPVDVGKEESVKEMADNEVKKFKTIEILFNAQGINVKMPASDINMETWDSMFRINVRGVVLPCKVIGKIKMRSEVDMLGGTFTINK